MFSLASVVAFLTVSAVASPLAVRQEASYGGDDIEVQIKDGRTEFNACEIIPVTWTGGQGPYIVVAKGKFSDNSTRSEWSVWYGDIRTHYLRWAAMPDTNPNSNPEMTEITFEITDTQNETGYLETPVQVKRGGNTCCRHNEYQYLSHAGTVRSICEKGGNDQCTVYPQTRCTYKFPKCDGTAEECKKKATSVACVGGDPPADLKCTEEGKPTSEKISDTEVQETKGGWRCCPK